MPVDTTKPQNKDVETPRGPQPDGGVPDRRHEGGDVPPIIKPGDGKNPNDPSLPG